MRLYEVAPNGEITMVFRTLKEARTFAATMGFPVYTIYRVETPKPTVQLLVDIINSQGGSYCLSREIVEEVDHDG